MERVVALVVWRLLICILAYILLVYDEILSKKGISYLILSNIRTRSSLTNAYHVQEQNDLKKQYGAWLSGFSKSTKTLPLKRFTKKFRSSDLCFSFCFVFLILFSLVHHVVEFIKIVWGSISYFSKMMEAIHESCNYLLKTMK